MTTSAPDQTTRARLEALEERTGAAWFRYREALRGLEPGEYEEVEPREWDLLQRALAPVERERAALAAEAESDPSRTATPE